MVEITHITLIKKATVECIKPHDLQVNDNILWANRSCKVMKINRNSSGCQKEYAFIQIVPEDPDNTLWIPKYSTFYRIIGEPETYKEEI